MSSSNKEIEYKKKGISRKICSGHATNSVNEDLRANCQSTQITHDNTSVGKLGNSLLQHENMHQGHLENERKNERRKKRKEEVENEERRLQVSSKMSNNKNRNESFILHPCFPEVPSRVELLYTVLQTVT